MSIVEIRRSWFFSGFTKEISKSLEYTRLSRIAMYLRYAIKSEISHETDREIRLKYENSDHEL